MTSVRAGLLASVPGGVAALVLLALQLPNDPAPGVTFSGSPRSDEAWMLLGARTMALLGTWATDDLQAYLLQLPFHVVQLVAFEIAGVGIVQARSVSLVLSVVTVVLVSLLVARHFGRIAAAVAGFGLGTSALFLYYGRLALLEPMVTFWLTAGASVLLLDPGRRRLVAGVIGGACLALAVGTKPSSLAAAVGILAGAALVGAARPTATRTFAVAGAVIVVAGIGWALLVGLPNREAVELVLRWWPEQPIPATPLDWLVRVGRYARASDGANLMALPLYVAAAVGVVLAWRRRASLTSGQRMLVAAAVGWVVLGIALLVLTAYRPNRYVVPLLPALAILGGVGAAQATERMRSTGRRAGLALAAILAAMALPGTILWAGWQATAASRLPAIQEEVLRIIDDGAAVEGGAGPAFAMRAPVPTLVSQPAIGMNAGDLYASHRVRWIVADETYTPAWAGLHLEAWAARETVRCWPWDRADRVCLIRVP